MREDNSAQSPWSETILNQTLLHITHLMSDKKHAQEKKGLQWCRAKQLLLIAWMVEAVTEEPLISILNFQLFLLFLPSNPSSVHHCCHTICNPFSINHLCINSTSASARRGSLSSGTGFQHCFGSLNHDDDRQILPLPHIRQVLCVGKQQLSSRWPHSSFISHWPATVTIAHVRTGAWVLWFLPKHLHSLCCSQCCFLTRRCQRISAHLNS